VVSASSGRHRNRAAASRPTYGDGSRESVSNLRRVVGRLADVRRQTGDQQKGHLQPILEALDERALVATEGHAMVEATLAPVQKREMIRSSPSSNFGGDGEAPPQQAGARSERPPNRLSERHSGPIIAERVRRARRYCR
jgi:hypothetical protein